MSDGDMDIPGPHAFLAAARRDFRQFYLTATPTDTGLMDGLVMAHAALEVGINTLRNGLGGKDRADVQRACIDAEQKFSELWEAVRACPTFVALIAAERAQIERDVFAGGHRRASTRFPRNSSILALMVI